MNTQPGETIHLRGPPRGFGEQGNKGIFSGKQGDNGLKLKGNTGNFGEQGTYRKSRFCFGETREQAHFFEGTGTPPQHGRASLYIKDKLASTVNQHDSYIGFCCVY